MNGATHTSKASLVDEARPFTYFAYGSNMLSGRLRNRCPSARLVGLGVAGGFGVAFHKRGKDGSGKATLVRDEGCLVHGVLYEIDLGDREGLDLAEGPGYERLDDFAVICLGTGVGINASTYMARPEFVEVGLLPFDWYMELIRAGAVENGLPPAHLARFHRVPHTPDPVSDRASLIEARLLLDQGDGPI